MWLKLFFLLLYLLLLFLLARVFEAVLWYETGVFATQLVDPVTLSYNKLKTILESRGLGYAGLAEKKEVSTLVQKSGELTQGELYSAIKKVSEQNGEESSSTQFSGEMHFYELVEDTKDGIWLIQVVAREREALLSHSNWGKMVQKVSQFGIRTGTFNCTKDYRSCTKRGWQRSSIIMSVPQTSASKGKVMMREYDGRRIEIEHIFRWMTSHVAHRIKTVRRSKQLVEEWRSDPSHPVKMFLFAHLPQPPAFFSALSVKFTGRIEFIFVDIRHWDDDGSLSEIGVISSPAYILKMPEGIYRYGNSPGEFLSLAAMDTFLRSVQPEVNDVFVLSLVLINLLAWMDLFITQGATVKRFVVLIRTLGTYNSLLLVSWLPVLALLQLPYLDWLSGYSLKVLRYADTTALASLLRADWTFYSSHPALFLSTYLAHGLLVDYFEKKRRCGDRTQDDSTSNLEWLASLWDWYTSYLLHPIASLHQFPLDHSDWDDDPNLLLDRLAFPDLWLRPLVNMDYIKDLPTWRLRGCDHRKEEDGDTESHSGSEGKEDASEHHEMTPPSCCHASSIPPCVCSSKLTVSTSQTCVCNRKLMVNSSQSSVSNNELTASSQPCMSNDKLTASSSRPCMCNNKLTASSTEPCMCSSKLTASSSQPCVCSSKLTANSSVCSTSSSSCGSCRIKGSPVSEDLLEDSVQEEGVVPSPACWPREALQCSECVVCLENFQEEDVLMALPCGHAFHQQCIVVWLSAGRHCCPVCRWPSYKKKQLTAASTL